MIGRRDCVLRRNNAAAGVVMAGVAAVLVDSMIHRGGTAVGKEETRFSDQFTVRHPRSKH